MTKDSMFFIGVDLGDKYSHLAILDQDGELIEEARLPSTPGAFQRKFSRLDPSRVALEVGSHSRWSSQVIQQLGHEVLVANARKLRAIYSLTLARTTGPMPRPWPAWRGSIPSCYPQSAIAPPRPRPIWP